MTRQRPKFAPVEIAPDRMPSPDDVPLPSSRRITPLDWDEAILLWRAIGMASNLSPRTIENREQVIRQLARWVAVEPARVTTSQLLAMQTRPIAPSSKQRNRSIYQQFFRWLFEEGYALDDPAKRLPKVKVPRADPRPVSVAQLEDVLARCRNRSTRTMILLGAYQGMRAAEIARVRGEMFDLDANQIRYIAKGGVARTQELHPIVRGEIGHYPRHGYWFPAAEWGTHGAPHINPKSVSQVIGHALRRAGISSQRLTAHSLRHFFGTELVAAGTDIRIVQELMGHAQLNSTQIYKKVPQHRHRVGLASLPQVTLPGAHFSRAHRRAWLSLADPATQLGCTEFDAARLAQTHGWRYTAENGTIMYAISDVDATRRALSSQ